MQPFLIVTREADIFVIREVMMNKKNIGFMITAGFAVLSVLLLLIKHITFDTVICLILNALAVFCTLIWKSTIPVIEIRRKAVSIVLWYGVIFIALFYSVKVLITK